MQSPIFVKSASGDCVNSAEICGDGVDQDCDGSDLLCSGSDGDRDGFPQGQDCDDSSSKVYPGIYTSCDASCGPGTQQCQSNGAFTACSCTPLCEATGSGRCFYISKLTGSDTSNGSFNQPWKTYRNIVTYNSPSDRPTGWQQLQPGDVVYFMSGVYNEIYAFGAESRAFYLQSTSGTSTNRITIKAYPGSDVQLARSSGDANAFYLFQSNNILVEGLNIGPSYGGGIRMTLCDNIEIRNVLVHDVDGIDNNNIAGISAGDVTNLRIHHSIIHDNYDRVCADTAGEKTENSRNLVFYAGGNVRVDHNTIFHSNPTTAQKTGSCVVYKHGQALPGGIFEVDHNTLFNCYYASIGTSTYGGRFHHNFIVDSDSSVSVRNHGDHVNLVDNTIEYNTLVRTPGASYTPGDAVDVGAPYGAFRFRNNLAFDVSHYSPDNGGIVKINPYGSDSVYSALIAAGYLSFSNNCYYNPNETVQFGLFSNNDNAQRLLGGLFDFAAWRLLGYDAGSVVANPNLDSSFRPGNGSCAAMGVFATP